ncbi:MliC family protein [Bartonella sp. CB169]|uniref:MliC family protein n=1 Tax=Bartonella sp. CB169 TaxID=3112257 RepID=UPI00300E0BFE
MKKTLCILEFLAASSLWLFSSGNALAGSLILEVPDNPEPKTQTVVYKCDTGINEERVEAIYLKAENISLVDFKWKGNRVIAANVIAATGAKYAGGQYIWWEADNKVTLYDLINDPEEKKPILCKDEETLLF